MNFPNFQPFLKFKVFISLETPEYFMLWFKNVMNRQVKFAVPIYKINYK